MAFKVPDHLVVKETEYWIINHRIDSKLPGYLMVGSRMETTNLFDLPNSALAELGLLLSSAQKALADLLHPEHIYVGRYGHQKGHSIHFHVIPIYSWVKEAFTADSRYGVLKSFYTPGASNSDYDGAELTLYVWREFCESKNPPQGYGPSVSETIGLLKERLSIVSTSVAQNS
ncbi:MAG: HIT family protein [Methylacidiphilales bacterium]|nr:HIT family protein [Candidatus Methylacidiphilales bacterium]